MIESTMVLPNLVLETWVVRGEGVAHLGEDVLEVSGVRGQDDAGNKENGGSHSWVAMFKRWFFDYNSSDNAFLQL